MVIAIKSTILFGQTDSLKRCECETDTTSIVFGDPEKMPTFPGHDKELFKFITKNLEYPQEAIEQKQEDRVFLLFCVLETGEISNIKVLRGKYEKLNNEAVRIIKLMPKWEPAFNNGKPICHKYVLPIEFKLKPEKNTHKSMNTKTPNR
jgi:TonB family protein